MQNSKLAGNSLPDVFLRKKKKCCMNIKLKLFKDVIFLFSWGLFQRLSLDLQIATHNILL